MQFIIKCKERFKRVRDLKYYDEDAMRTNPRTLQYMRGKHANIEMEGAYMRALS